MDTENKNGMIDTAGKVRDGEQLDIVKVTEWLKGYLNDLDDQPEVTQFSGGASNWTYRLKYKNHDLILRRPPAGTKAKSAHDMGREYKVQNALQDAYPVVPKMIGLCTDESVLGDEFYVMERVEGIIPRARLPKDLKLSEKQINTLCKDVIEKLVQLHKVDYLQTDLKDLSKGLGYPKRQFEGWAKRYTNAKTWNVPSFKYVTDWLRANTPEDIAACVIHNDWRFDNVILDPKDPTQIIGVLDWEMATIGDPLVDLGSALAYWVQADDDFLFKISRRQPTHLPGMMTRKEVVEYYLGRMEFNIDTFDWYEVFGLFRLAGIAQQIYFRYHHKQTDNPAFKNFWLMVQYLNFRCKKIIKASKI